MNTVGIEVLDLEHLSTQNVANSFLTTLQSTNWKVMRCYNLVFNFKIFCHNYGSILILILFIIYIIFMIFFCVKEISPIKVEVSKIIFEDLEEVKEIETYLLNYYENDNTTKTRKTKPKRTKGNFPPKKERIKNQKNKRVGFQKIPENKERKRKVKYNNKSVYTEHNDLISEKKLDDNKTTKSDYRSEKPSKRRRNKQFEMDMKEEKENRDKKNMDNFELNDLGFEDACKFDKRTCLRTYWSVLLREHIMNI